MKEKLLYKLNNLTIVFMFCVAISIPFSLGVVEKDKDVSKIEKRELSKYPEMPRSIGDIKKFPELFDAYYSDHFGLRDLFTEYYKVVKYTLGDSPSNDVLIGKDGWLFLGSVKRGYSRYGDPIGDLRNINLYSGKDLHAFAKYMMALKLWLKDQDIEYVFVIAPNKHTIYSEKLPDYISKANKYSVTDQLVEYLKLHTDVTVVDLRKALLENKDKHQLYYKTDTHWNHYGANIAQYEIMLEIEKLFPESIQPSMVNTNDGDQGGGDLSRYIGVNSFKELNPQPIFENTCMPIRQINEGDEKITTKARVTFSFNCKGQKLKTVIFRDSFFTALEPYFSRKFKRATYIWKKLNYPLLKEYIASEDPDVIIEEWVARDLPFYPNPIKEFNYLYNRYIFNCSEKLLFSNNYKKLSFNKHLEIQEEISKSITLKSIGIDPIIIFPSIPFAIGNEYMMHVNLLSSVDSFLQIFYSDSNVAGYPFSENNSVRVDIKVGVNDIIIPIAYKDIGKNLRLDPISGVGEIKINTLEIKEVKKRLTKRCSRIE